MKKLLAIIAALCAMCCVLVACNDVEEEPEATATPTAVATPAATELPDIELEYDKTKFVMDGVVLKSYIGNETTVVIPAGTVIIDDNAFRGCTTVEAVDFSEAEKSMKTIGNYAFYGCTALKSMAVPSLVTSIGDYAFAECTALTSIETKTNTSSVGKYAFYNCVELTTAKLSSNLSIVNEGLFEGCKKLTSFATGSAKEAMDRAFYGCEALTTVEGKVLATLHDEVFAGCTALANVSKGSDGKVVLDNLTSVGVDAFKGTAWLTDATKKAAEAEKEKDAFVTVGKGVLIYHSTAKVEDKTVLELDSSVKCIAPDSLVEWKDTLETAKIPQSVTTLGIGAFEGFTKLTSVELPAQITAVSDYAFANCTELATVVMPKVETIGDYAFDGCVKLSSITEKASKTESNTEAKETVVNISKSVTSIGDYAFRGCVAITGIEASDKLVSIGTGAFEGCAKLDVADVKTSFGAVLTSVGAGAFDGTAWLTNWNGTEETKVLVIGDGVVVKSAEAEIEDSDAIKYISITMGGQITTVPEKAFYNNKKVTSIIVPEGVTAIGAEAFYFAENVKEIVLPASVKTIGAKAFYGCKNLETVIIPEGVTEISDYAFYGCANLKTVVIPSSVTKIGKYAFYNCISLEEIAVPAAVNAIGEYAFANTAWIEATYEEFVVVGNGILVKYNGLEKEVKFDGTEPAFSTIAGGAFEGTLLLETITLPASVKNIGAYAFSGCTTLKSLTSSATTVGERAFNNCTALETATFAGGASVAADAFNGCENKK